MKNTASKAASGARDSIESHSVESPPIESSSIESPSFESLGIAPFLCGRLLERSIQRPTEIQNLVIPRLLTGESVLFRAPTGTGKTFAYLLPLFQRVLPLHAGNHGKARILICAPTYELCSQIKGEADFLLAAWHASAAQSAEAARPEAVPRAALVIGSVNMERQTAALKKEKPPVIVGNPGRLLQLARMGRLKLDGVQAVVLDEGDRLLADELREETLALFRFLPKNRQSAACSATVSAKSRERLFPLLGSGAVFLETKGNSPVIEHWAFFSEGRKKAPCLRSLLAAARPKKALVFTARREDAGAVLSRLQYHHFAAGGIWGDMDKGARKASLEGFRRGSLSILVATDLACRGLDIPGISHVIALDVPDDPELYLHRSGRTGRTVKRGIMASIGTEEELRRLRRIEKKLGIIVYPKELYGGRILAAGEITRID